MDTDMDIPLPTAMATILARGLLMPSQKLMLTMAALDMDMDVDMAMDMDMVTATVLLDTMDTVMATQLLMDMATTSARGPLMLLLRPMLTTAASDMVMDVDTAMDMDTAMATVTLDTRDTAMLLMLTMVMAMDFITNLLNFVKI